MVAVSTVSRFTVLLNPGAGSVDATNGSDEPPSKLPEFDPSRLDKDDRLLKLSKLGSLPVKLLGLGKLLVKLLKLGKLPVRPVKLGNPDVNPPKPGKPEVRLLRLGRLLVKLLRLGKLMLPKLLKLVKGLVAPVANCAAFPNTLRSVAADVTVAEAPEVKLPRLGRPDILGKPEDPVIPGRLEVRLPRLGKLLAHWVAACVPNLVALATKAPTSAVTALVSFVAIPLIFCRLPVDKSLSAPDARVVKLVVADDNRLPTEELAKDEVNPLMLGKLEVSPPKLGNPFARPLKLGSPLVMSLRLGKLGIENDIPVSALNADKDCKPLCV